VTWYTGPCGHLVPITCHECDRPALGGVTDSQLAVLFRQLQWELDDAAYAFPPGRITPRQREELAGTLEALAVIVRVSVPSGSPAGRRLSRKAAR